MFKCIGKSHKKRRESLETRAEPVVFSGNLSPENFKKPIHASLHET